jgi:hypothetical protein
MDPSIGAGLLYTMAGKLQPGWDTRNARWSSAVLMELLYEWIPNHDAAARTRTDGTATAIFVRVFITFRKNTPGEQTPAAAYTRRRIIATAICLLQ